MGESMRRLGAMLATVLVFALAVSPTPAFADADGSSVQIMTEWVNYYYNYQGLYDLNTTDECVKELDDIIADPNTNWLKGYNWGNSDAWERDWKSSTLTGGNDYRLADDVDLAAFAGHGYGRNFVMNNANYDYFAAISDMRLGDRDLEWLLAYTCNFLNGTVSELGGMMRGLHLANGYATQMIVTSNGGARFAAWAKAPYGVRVAWYRQAYDSQPNTLSSGGRIIARTFGHRNNVNDYLWGYGSAGSDPPVYSSTTAGDYLRWDYDVYGH